MHIWSSMSLSQLTSVYFHSTVCIVFRRTILSGVTKEIVRTDAVQPCKKYGILLNSCKWYCLQNASCMWTCMCCILYVYSTQSYLCMVPIQYIWKYIFVYDRAYIINMVNWIYYFPLLYICPNYLFFSFLEDKITYKQRWVSPTTSPLPF